MKTIAVAQCVEETQTRVKGKVIFIYNKRQKSYITSTFEVWKAKKLHNFI